jgi:plasmid stabilization system protein ParE
MAYQLIQKKRFKNKLVKLLDYLETEWGFKVAESFLKKVDKHLESISHHPFLGRPEAYRNVRSVLITKHNRVYYRFDGKTIKVLNMYDTRMSPKKNRYK